ncbi:DUF2264 domain-containing protein [Actinospica robiniae]|uniref:DUF2264 domain-containing protein n=1 Tax=Actinospica robiniae TaxID=304901 RepID=UPI0004124954|nr:DUF2264 domain-containing protein [Actinospica robiniae]
MDHSDLAPYTGWTRADWTGLADRLLDAVTPYASPSFARYQLPGTHTSHSGNDSDALEGYARTFLLAAFRIAGERGEGPVATKLLERYAAGIAAGTDPAGSEAWLPIVPGRATQPMVEAASIALGLHETRAWLWEKLAPDVQERVTRWLGGFIGNHTWPNNWMLFQTISEEFLASVGADHRDDEIVRGLDALEGWYVGDGWYTDGRTSEFDYYNAWALHLYPLMWTRIADGGARGARAVEAREVYRSRLRRFLEDYPKFIGGDGAPMHQGRSLTYRFGAAAPLWVGELFDCTPLSPGETRRAASGIAKHFIDRGAVNAQGLLSLGWYGEHLPTVQPYSGPASPYWASKAFLGLLLPSDHRVWTAVEEPLPVERADFVTVLNGPNWILQGTQNDGIVRLHNHGSDHVDRSSGHEQDDPFYSKLAYSTATAPDTAEESWVCRVDSHIALISPDDTPSRRGAFTRLGASADGDAAWAGSVHIPHVTRADGEAQPIEGAQIESWTIAWRCWDLRIHAVDATEGWGVREGGYAVAGHEPLAIHDDAVSRPSDGLTSSLTGILGWTRQSVHEAAEANAYGSHSAAPALHAAHPGGRAWYASLASLTRPAEAGATDAAASIQIQADGSIIATFPDGHRVALRPAGE